MSSSSMCQTVYDTIRTVVYDTVHTSVFDTVHTVSFDTVHSLVYDSAAVTVQALRDSQAFYSNSFSWLIGVTGIAVAIATLFVTAFSFFKTNSDSRKLKSKFDARSSEVAKEETAKIAAETKKEFDKAIEEQKMRFASVAQKSKKLWNETIPLVLISAKRTKDNAAAIGDLYEIIKLLSGNLDEDQATLVMVEILPELEKRIRTIEFSDGFDNFIMGLQEQINFFKSRLSPSMNEAKKNVIEKMIDDIVAITNSRIKEFYDMKFGSKPRRGRFGK